MLNRLRSILPLLLLLSPGAAVAWEVPVMGTVLDGWTRQPVIGATVTIRRPDGSAEVCVTDESGRWPYGWADPETLPDIEIVIEAASAGYLPFAEVVPSPKVWGSVGSPPVALAWESLLAPREFPSLPSLKSR